MTAWFPRLHGAKGKGGGPSPSHCLLFDDITASLLVPLPPHYNLFSSHKQGVLPEMQISSYLSPALNPQWLPISLRIKTQVLTTAHKALWFLAFTYLSSSIFNQVHSVATSLRSSVLQALPSPWASSRAVSLLLHHSSPPSVSKLLIPQNST